VALDPEARVELIDGRIMDVSPSPAKGAYEFTTTYRRGDTIVSRVLSEIRLAVNDILP